VLDPYPNPSSDTNDGKLNHTVFRDQIGWNLVGLNVMNKVLIALGLVRLTGGRVR
jgi:hypothetical protein